MSGPGGPAPPGERPAGMAQEPGRLVTQRVRHAFWKYPIIAAVLAVALGLLGAFAGSPNTPRATIAQTSRQDPGGAILAFSQELSGDSPSWANRGEFGMGPPDQVFVTGPVSSFAPLLGAQTATALARYRAAPASQQRARAETYVAALGTVTPQGEGGGGMEGAASPDYARIGSLRGDFGPVPALARADLSLAQNGHLEQYLVGLNPGHSLHLVTVWLYDHPTLLNTALAEGLTDDQWGMVKERGYPVGPWYLIIPAVFHVEFPQGATGTGFLLWNLAAALVFVFLIPLLPGLRSLPRRLRLDRFVARYPTRGEQVPPDPEAGLHPLLREERPT